MANLTGPSFVESVGRALVLDHVLIGLPFFHETPPLGGRVSDFGPTDFLPGLRVERPGTWPAEGTAAKHVDRHGSHRALISKIAFART